MKTIKITLSCNFTAGEFKIKNFDFENGKEKFSRCLTGCKSYGQV